MIGTGFQFTDQTKRIETATEKAGFKNFSHAAAAIRKDAVESIENLPGPSEPGETPHTHTGGITKQGKVRKGNLQRAITFAASQEEAVIGPRESVVGLAGRAHELGEAFHGDDFPERPYMEPALEENMDRFASEWAGSIGE